MLKKIFCVVILSVLCTTSIFAADSRYIVRFKSAPLKAKNPSHADVVHYLQSNLKSNMAALKTRSNSFKNANPLWVANAFAFTGTAKDIAELKKNPMVAEVFESKYEIFMKIPKKNTVRDNLSVVQWGVKKVNAPDVWQEHKIDGAGVVVGVLDTGINPDHPALKGKILAFKDFTGDKSEKPIDTQGHGSHVSGSIVGSSGVGVAPGAKLIVARVFDNKGGTTTETLLNAMQWMLDPDGVPETNDAPRVVNNSWGSSSSTNKTFWVSVENWVQAGILPAFAAGNDGYWGGKVGTPAAFPHSWAVAATASNDTLAAFSSTGPVFWDGKELIKPDIAAPGKDIISCSHKDGSLVSMSGTSMACPHAAGVAALLFQADPSLTPEDVMKILASTALDLGDSGKDNKFGFGLMDSAKAVKAVLAKTRLINSYRHYEETLAKEKALTGVQTRSMLAAPLATYIIEASAELSDKEFEALSDEVLKNCGTSAKKVLKDAEDLRTARKLHTAEIAD